MLLTFLDLGFAIAHLRSDTIAFYDRLAPRYERIHRRWLRTGAAETMAALHGCLSAELHPGARVLDAGCGTGVLARWILAQEPQTHVIQLDAATGMLDQARAVPCDAVRGDLLHIPFGGNRFDVVVCSWVLETVRDPRRAIRELKRVLAPGGLLCCCHCAQPPSRRARLRSIALRLSVTHLFKGRFLQPGLAEIWGHDRIRWIPCYGGLSAFTCYRKPSGGAE